MLDGREYSINGWCRNREALDDEAKLMQILHTICERIAMRVLRDVSVHVEKDLEKKNLTKFHDEGGATALLCLSTSHAAIHGWPHRDFTRSDGGYFRLNVSSCRDFNPDVVDQVVTEFLGATVIQRIVNVAVVPPKLSILTRVTEQLRQLSLGFSF